MDLAPHVLQELPEFPDLFHLGVFPHSTGPFRARFHVSKGLSTDREIEQGRRDSNPQQPVLETGALAVRATALRDRSSPGLGPPRKTLLSLLVRDNGATSRTELPKLEAFGV